MVETIVPQESARRGLYHVRDADSDEELFLYVEPLDHPPDPEPWAALLALPATVVEVRETLTEGRHFGWTIPRPRGTPLEPATRGAGGSRQTWVSERLAPLAVRAVLDLHAGGLIHGALAPGCFRYRDEERTLIALTGFSLVQHPDRDPSLALRRLALRPYQAPEVFPELVPYAFGNRSRDAQRGADWYALGLTLVELVLGPSPLHGRDLAGHLELYRRGEPLPLPEGPPRFRSLVAGLLIRDPQHRWGPQEVERWLDGANTSSDLSRIEADDRQIPAVPRGPEYRLGGLRAVSLVHLARILTEARKDRERAEKAREDLRSGAIVHFVRALHPGKGERLAEIGRSRGDDIEGWMTACIQLCDPRAAFEIRKGLSVDDPREWPALVIQWLRASELPPPKAQSALDRMLSMQEIKRLLDWIETRDRADGRAVERLRELLGRKLPSDRQLVFESIAYAVNGQLGFSVHQSLVDALAADGPLELADSADAYVDWVLGSPEGWRGAEVPQSFRKAADRFAQGFVAVWLRSRLEDWAPAGDPTIKRIRDRLQTALGLAEGAKASGDLLVQFDRFLRHLAPGVCDVLSLTLHWDPGVVVSHGFTRRVPVQYALEGRGVAHGRLVVQDRDAIVAIAGASAVLLAGRQGRFELAIVPRSFEIQAGDDHRAVFVVESDEPRSVGLRAPHATFSYRIEPPLALTVGRALLTALAAALVLALARGALRPWQPASWWLDGPERWQTGTLLGSGIAGTTFFMALILVGVAVLIRWRLTGRRPRQPPAVWGGIALATVPVGFLAFVLLEAGFGTWFLPAYPEAAWAAWGLAIGASLSVFVETPVYGLVGWPRLGVALWTLPLFALFASITWLFA